jgi:hypothetical protein
MTEAEPRRVVRVAAPDDALIRALTEHRTAKAGWRIAALAAPDTIEPDALVIIDFDDDQSVRRAVEQLQDFDGPIVILGGVAAEIATDFEVLPRPVRLGALIARLDAHQEAAAELRTIVLGPYELSPTERMLRPLGEGEAIRLTELEGRLLACLAEAGGALVGREELLARVWGYSENADTHTVETHVWRLRQKIETDDPASRFLVTEQGGYRLVLADDAGSG